PDVPKYLSAALVAAAGKGQTEMVKFLIGKGADVNFKDSGRSPLLESLDSGTYYPETIAALIQAKADVNLPEKKGRKTPLMQAVHMRNLQAVKDLITAGAQINYLTTEGERLTALYIAVDRDQKEIVSYLIEKGANVNLRGDQNLPPLVRAVQRGNKEIVKILLDAKAHVNASEVEGEDGVGTFFALNEAVLEKPVNLEIMEILLGAQANVNRKNSQGQTALHRSVSRQYQNATELLLSHGADVNVQDTKSSDTPLMRLCAESPHTQPNEAFFKMLITQGAKLDIENKFGDTALLIAARVRNTKMVDLLITLGADKNHVNKKGEGLKDLL
ncbi:MAG: ankyrin repeat protein, partial [uncultured bacterium]